MAKKRVENVLDVSFFEEDIVAFDDQIGKTEGLYDEVHGLYAEITSGEGTSFKMLRDSAELAKTLSSIRSTAMDGINKRFQAKRSIADMEQKKQAGQDENKNLTEVARAMVLAVRSDPELRTVTAKSSSNESRSQLDDRLNYEINADTIKLNSNEKSMKHAFRGVEVVYKKSKNKFMAVAKSGELIEDYPIDRVLDNKIVREEDGFAIASGGSKYRIV